MISPLEKFRDLVASTAAWQGITSVDPGEGAAADAAEFIVFGGEELDPSPPMLTLRSDNYVTRRIGAQVYRPAGAIGFLLDLPVPPATADFKTEYAAVAATVETLVKDIISTSKTNGGFEIERLEIQGPMKYAPEREGPDGAQWWFATGTVWWPAGGG